MFYGEPAPGRALNGLVGWLAGWLVDWLAGLVGWAGWLVPGWLAGWLVGWLAGLVAQAFQTCLKMRPLGFMAFQTRVKMRPFGVPVAMHPLPRLALIGVSPASAPHLCLFCSLLDGIAPSAAAGAYWCSACVRAHLCLFCSLSGGNAPTAAAGAHWCFACVRAPLVPFLLAAQCQCTLCHGWRFLMFRLRPRPTCASFAHSPVAMHPLPRQALIGVLFASAAHLCLFCSLPSGNAPSAMDGAF